MPDLTREPGGLRSAQATQAEAPWSRMTDPADLLQARFSTARIKRRRVPRLLRIADHPGIAAVCGARADPDTFQDDTHYLAGRPDAGL